MGGQQSILTYCPNLVLPFWLRFRSDDVTIVHSVRSSGPLGRDNSRLPERILRLWASCVKGFHEVFYPSTTCVVLHRARFSPSGQRPPELRTWSFVKANSGRSSLFSAPSVRSSFLFCLPPLFLFAEPGAWELCWPTIGKHGRKLS
jgi:hypothetical protein